jgi:ribonuclease HI
MKDIQRPLTGICVDGSSKGNPGPSKYRAVDVLTRQEKFNVNIGVDTANAAEFIGLSHAIKICLDPDSLYDTIYSDSLVAMRWVLSRGGKKNRFSEKDYIQRCNVFLSGLRVSGRIDGESYDYILILDPETNNHVFIRKWMTKQWGENPADFGHKK